MNGERARSAGIRLLVIIAAASFAACEPAASGDDSGPGGAQGGGSAGASGSGAGGAQPGGRGAVGGAAGTSGIASGGSDASGSGGSGGSGVGAGAASGTAGASGGGGTVSGTGGASGSGGAGAAAGSGGAPGGSGGAGSQAGLILNDRFWRDTAGIPIYSQGGGVLQVTDTFYWYGVKYRGAVAYAANPAGGDVDDTTFEGVTIYSSKNLSDWKLENTVRFSNAGGWFGRLGVVYHAATRKYVLVAQGGGGLYFATSDTPNGTFVFDNIQTNLPGIVNGSTGDQTTFQDDDGQAYLISSSSSGRANRYVSPLRASDYLAVENAVLVYRGTGREGNCMFKHAGTYYFCSSDLHGWNSSQAYCVSASNIRGPYSAEFVMDGTAADFSHVTQTGFFISVKGTAQNTIIFAGDRWSDFAGNGLGYNQWMPLSFTGTTPRMESLSAWSIDATAGTWSAALQNNYALNPSFEADRVEMTQPAGWTATNSATSADGRTGRWGWQLAGTSSLNQRLTGLPNGTYTLSAWIKASAAGASLSAKGFGGTDKSVSIGGSSAWTNVTVSGISVSNGQCEIGVATSGQSVTVDDFTLIRG